MGGAVFLLVFGVALGAAGGYAGGYSRGLTTGALRATRRQVVQVDDILSRWRRGQEP